MNPTTWTLELANGATHSPSAPWTPARKGEERVGEEAGRRGGGAGGEEAEEDAMSRLLSHPLFLFAGVQGAQGECVAPFASFSVQVVGAALKWGRRRLALNGCPKWDDVVGHLKRFCQGVLVAWFFCCSRPGVFPPFERALGGEARHQPGCRFGQNVFEKISCRCGLKVLERGTGKRRP